MIYILKIFFFLFFMIWLYHYVWKKIKKNNKSYMSGYRYSDSCFNGSTTFDIFVLVL